MLIEVSSLAPNAPTLILFTEFGIITEINLDSANAKSSIIFTLLSSVSAPLHLVPAAAIPAGITTE